MREKQKESCIIPALSNNNHELFHSNLWKWLMETDREFIKCFFKSYDTNNEPIIKRESDNLDLKIIDKVTNKQYIIENKLKSIPNYEQLERYKERQEDKNDYKTKYLLVFLIKNEELKTKDWKSISYIRLAKRLKEKLKERKKEIAISKYYEMLLEYCDYIINDFNKIRKSKYVKSKKYYFGEDGIDDAHIDEGLKVIYQKMKSEKFIYKLDENINIKKYDKKFEKKQCSLTSYLGYNHGKPCFTYRIQYKNWGKKRAELRKHTAMEIQLEGNQYRHMVRLIKDNKDKAEKIDEGRQKKYYKRAIEIFDRTSFLSISKNDKGKGFAKYDGPSNIAIYKYCKINEAISDKPDVEDVAKFIKKDLNSILKYVSKAKIKRFLQDLR